MSISIPATRAGTRARVRARAWIVANQVAPAVYTESALALAATEVPTQVRVVTIAYLRIAL